MNAIRKVPGAAGAWAILVLLGVMPGSAGGSDEEMQGYRIQPGDVLQVSVWKEPDLERDVLVRPDTGLSFPLVGDISAAGKSVEELRQEISERIARFIPDPVVAVAVTQTLGNKVYVIGKVNRPGEFVMNRRVDVMQALSMAGGANAFAALRKIKVLRRLGDRTTVIPFDYAQIERGEDLEQNIVLQPGDVVVVP